MDTGMGTEKVRTIEQQSVELREALNKFKGEIESFLSQPECKKPSDVPTPMNNPLSSINDNLDECRGLVGDIIGLINSIFTRIR